MTDSYNTTSIAVLCEDDFLPWKIVKPLYENQIEFNYLQSSLLIEACKIENDTLLIGKQKYQILIIENAQILTKSLCEKINEFIRGGGKVILYNPKNRVHGLSATYEIKEIHQVVNELDNLIKTDIIISPSNTSLRTSHIIKDGLHLYCLVNEGDLEINIDIKLSCVGFIEKWDPWKGTVEKLYAKDVCDDGVIVPLSLGFRESLILCVDDTKAPEIMVSEDSGRFKEYPHEKTLSWQIDTMSNEPKQCILLDSWTNWSGFENFSGTISYSSIFNIDKSDIKGRIIIDLGEVHEICELYLNGTNAGVCFWPPYRFDITDYVKPGENIIEIRVTNTLANKIEKARNKSGLLGPVRFLYTES